MKVAVLTSSLPPYPTGGAERQAAETARRLAARGHAVTVFARRMLADTPAETTEDGVRWIRCAAWHRRGLGFPSHLASFARAWERNGKGIEVVLAYQMVINGVLGLWAARRGTPLVSWIRSQAEIALDASRKYRWWTPRVAGGSRRVLVQADRLRRELLENLGRRRGPAFAGAIASRIRVLPNAVDPGPEPGPGSRDGLVYVGRLLPVKGLDVLLQALRTMEAPPPLTVIGDGPSRADFVSRAEGLPVTFRGFVPQDELPPLLERARLLVAPSRSEGFPNALLEAMARGTPVVASDVGGVAEVVGDGRSGRLVPPGDPPALAAALREVLSDEKAWGAMAAAARARAREFGWDAHLDRLETILGEAIVEGRR